MHEVVHQVQAEAAAALPQFGGEEGVEDPMPERRDAPAVVGVAQPDMGPAASAERRIRPGRPGSKPCTRLFSTRLVNTCSKGPG